MNPSPTYRGRFAPSPSGPLHAGSLATALASWLDARAHGGAWLVRIEDLDTPRTVPGAANAIVQSLARCGLVADESVIFQSEGGAHYERAFNQLLAGQRVFACSCSRKDVAQASVPVDAQSAARPGVYPGSCRNGLAPGHAARAWRFRVDDHPVEFVDRACGAVIQNLATEVGDFIVRRADGPWAYQLAVVVDDGWQGITHVVRGADLIDNTARQMALQYALGLPLPIYLHVPLVVNARGEKLSKQTGAAALDSLRPLAELERAALHLGLPALGASSIDNFLHAATTAWVERLDTLEQARPAARAQPKPKE